MLWTRVGYAGGTLADPTYRNLGDHTETLEVGFDPERITFSELLETFLSAHNPTAAPHSRQYRSVVFSQDAAQAAAAGGALTAHQASVDREVHTAIEPDTGFYQAEGYHQKFRLRRKRDVFEALERIYPNVDDLVRSTAAARLNAWAAGWLSIQDRRRDLPRVGIDLALLDATR